MAKRAGRRRAGPAPRGVADALRLHREGKLDEAATRYAAIIKAQPRHFDALHMLGVVRYQQGRHAEAYDKVRAALRLQPANVEAQSHLGMILGELGRPEEALASLDEALAIRPDCAPALNARGNVLRGLNRTDEALASYDKALMAEPDDADALANRGVALRDLKRPEEALASYDRALAIRPDDVEALYNRGNVLLELRRLDEALACYDRALALRPDFAPALSNRGTVLRDLERPEESLASCERVLALRPDDAEAFNNRGNALQDLKRPAEALASFDKALALRPDYPRARYNRAMTALSTGDFAAGWADYEHRWERPGAPARRLSAPYPAWRGEALRGRRLIVYEEQGLGDIIQFARFLPLLEAAGASVTFLVRPSLHRLLRPLAATVRLVEAPPPGEAFDFQCALMSLPAALGTTLATIPAQTPYLAAEAELTAAWRARLGEEGLKIGLCWQGNPRGAVDIGRSFPLRAAHPLASVPGVRLISLQKGDGADQLAALPAGMAVETLGADLDAGPDAFVDTAAIIAALDLVVTSDTAIAHLAGALGRPVWVALKHAADWRWLQDRADSPWYPTARLFRQPRRGDWDAVFTAMAAELAAAAPGADALFQSGFAAHRAGRLDAAARDYRAALDAEPGHFDARHLLGVVRFQQGNDGEAIETIRAALALRPRHAEALSNLGLVLAKAGRLDEALANYDEALAVRPDYAEAFNNRGNALHELGRPQEALASYDRALALRPGYAEALHNRGSVLRDLGRPADALANYDEALALWPDNAEIFNNRGIALQELERPADALASFDHALALRSDYAEALSNRGVALQRLKRLEVALASYDRALAIRPDYAEAHNNRGTALLDLRRPDEALASYDRALAIRPDSAEALNNRGNALRDRERPEEAVASFDRALALRPDYAEAMHNRGNALQELKLPAEALACHNAALALRPDYVAALFDRGIVALSTGDFAAGWAGYEYRWDHEATPPRKLKAPYPAWRGEALQGRRLIVYEEQGLGDVIQFVRFLPLVAAAGADVTFLVRPALHRLLRPLAATVRLVDAPPPDEAFDFQCALMSLPAALGTTAETIPAEIPYLAAEAELTAAWRARLGESGLKVGLCWQGNPGSKADIGRSFPLFAAHPLASLPGVRLISLQKADGIDQLAALPEGMAVETLGDDFDAGPDAFVDTAAVIANLDLVVTADTAIAHLAGALGRPVWVALKHVPDWRWMLDRGDSPWYPTARLFRQPARGDWDAVFAAIAAELAGTAVSATLRDAVAAHREGRLDAAARGYAAVLEAAPGHFDALHLLGVVRFQQGNDAEALQRISAALALRPAHAEALSNLGLVLKKLGRYDDALASYDGALAIRPDYADALNNRGIALRELGRLDDALASYDRALAIRPDAAEALNNRGIVLRELKRPAEALASYDKALAIQPDNAETHNNRGIALLDLGRPEEALASYDAALALRPDYTGALNNRGVALRELARPEAALASYDRALALRPDYAEAHNNRGTVLQELGRPAEALANFDRALALRPDYAEALANRGNALRDLNRLDDALASCDAALALRPDYAEAYNNRGGVLRGLGRSEEALASYDRALAVRPDYAEALSNRGAALQDLDRSEEALASYDRALAIRPDHAEALSNRGAVLHELGQAEEALASYDRALAIRPVYPEALANRGNLLVELRRAAEAVASYDRALAARPDHAAAHFGRSLALLLRGDYAQGWRAYEWRWREGSAEKMKPRPLAAPQWQGEDLAGMTLLLHAEQGFGDTLQFCRYATLAGPAARVILEVPRPLVRLCASLAGVAQIVAAGDPLPAFDRHSPLLSLPRIAGTTVETIPARVPYLAADPAQAGEWRRRLAALPGMRVGLVWAGSPRPSFRSANAIDRRRSTSLLQFAPLARVPGISLVSLQKGAAAAQTRALPPGFVVHDWTDEIDDFADTAALVEALDLVISVDTSVVHLAGALAKPVWVLNRFDGCWRWLLDRDDSPWYPTALLFRQRKPGDWDEMIARVAGALAQLAARRKAEGGR